MDAARPAFRLRLPPFLLRMVWALVGCVLLAGCPTVRFVSEYDVEVDRGVTAFQQRIERHLAGLERHLGTPAAEFSQCVDFYDAAAIDLGVLRTRAALSPHNEITVQQLDLLIRNLGRLVALHHEGLAANDLPPLRTVFTTSCTAIIKFELAKKRDEKPEP